LARWQNHTRARARDGGAEGERGRGGKARGEIRTETGADEACTAQAGDSQLKNSGGCLCVRHGLRASAFARGLPGFPRSSCRGAPCVEVPLSHCAARASGGQGAPVAPGPLSQGEGLLGYTRVERGGSPAPRAGRGGRGQRLALPAPLCPTPPRGDFSWRQNRALISFSELCLWAIRLSHWSLRSSSRCWRG